MSGYTNESRMKALETRRFNKNIQQELWFLRGQILHEAFKESGNAMVALRQSDYNNPNNPFRQATKEKAKLKIMLAGASGSGKTWTALEIATRIVAREGGRVALIDTEGGAASKYASNFDFDVLDLSGDYNPKRYINSIKDAMQYGYTVLVIDSASHAWNGTGGVLQIADRSKIKNNKISGWATARPVHNHFVDAILDAQLHVIVTTRAKASYEMVEHNGKKIMSKVGVTPVQDSDFEFEFDIAGFMNEDHTINISKTRCSPLDGANAIDDLDEFVDIVHGWVTDGVTPVERKPQQQAPAKSQPTIVPQVTDDEVLDFTKQHHKKALYDLTKQAENDSGITSDDITAFFSVEKYSEIPNENRTLAQIKFAISELSKPAQSESNPQQTSFVEPENEYGTTTVITPKTDDEVLDDMKAQDGTILDDDMEDFDPTKLGFPPSDSPFPN